MQLSKISLLASFGLFLSLCTLPSEAEAIFASVKSTGMAATAIAYPLDSLAIAYNPAGIVLVGNRLDLEVGWLHNKGTARVNNNLNHVVNGCFDGMSRKDYPAGSAGFVYQFCIPCYENPAAFGIAAYNRNFQKTRFTRVEPLFGTCRQGLEYVHMTIAPAFAFTIWDCHSFGIALNWQIERIKVDGLENFDNPFFSLHPHHVTNRGYNYAHGITPTFGWRSQLWDCLAFGFTYQPKTHMSRLHKYKGFLVKGRLDIPEKVGLGFAFYAMPQLVVCFDMEWVNWESVDALANPLLHNNHLMALGSEHGPGFGFKNQIYYRLGVEYLVDDCWTLRAGFRYANTPVRNSQAAVNALTLDLVQYFLTFGATYRFDCWNEFSAFFAYGFRHHLKGERVIPLLPFGGGNVSLTEEKYAAGISWGWNY